MHIPIFNREHRWECPNCELTDVTRESKPHTRFHACSGLKGLTAPMVPAGTRCHVRANEREDYVGNEVVTVDGEGRPVMSVETLHEDGHTDLAVLAPCATTNAEGN